MLLDPQSRTASAPALPTPAAVPERGGKTVAYVADPHVSTPQFAFNQAAVLLKQQLAPPAAPFADHVRGTDAKAIDLTLAKLSQDVYHPQSKGIEGWHKLDASQLLASGIDPGSLEDPSTGFRAAVYQDDQGHHVLAFAGSNDVKDWLDNGRQGIGLPAAEYDQAVTLATQAKAAFGDELVITGHSLGGGLASIASLATDTPAVTFNAAGLNDATIRREIPDGNPSTLKQQAGDGLIRRYAVQGEILTGLQQHAPIPDAVGHAIALSDPAPVGKPDIHWYDWLDGAGEAKQAVYEGAKAKHSVRLHSIDPVIASMEKAPLWAR